MTALGLAGAAGLALGSYAVTTGIRYSRAEPSVLGRSHCDACGCVLGFTQTIPVVSFWRAAGACRLCRAHIDRTHLVGELAGAVALVGAVWVPDPWRALLVAALGLVLVTTATVDRKVRRLPDIFTLAIALLALLLAAGRSPAALGTGLVAAAAAFGLLTALRGWTGRGGREPGLGFGDVKLICALALWLGAATPWMVVAASGLGLVAMAVARPVDGRLPFGPSVAVSAWAIGLIGELGLWPTPI